MKIPHMLSRLRRLFSSSGEFNSRIGKIEQLQSQIHSLLESQILLGGSIHALLNKNLPLDVDIKQTEFKVFSQWGDDGIIQFLIQQLNIKEKVFVEFGVESYLESNTRFLLHHNNWRGLVIDGSENNIKSIKNRSEYWRFDLTAVAAFIDCGNINNIIQGSGFTGDIGILSIDIDGNDYWIWKIIKVVNPVFVIVEYNSVFGSDRAITIPYDPVFTRDKAHHTNLYYGASLAALDLLARSKGYSLVGCNSAGNNAYFVRNDRLLGLKQLDVESAYVESHFRESRDTNGNLTFTSGHERIKLLNGLKVFNVATNQEELI